MRNLLVIYPNRMDVNMNGGRISLGYRALIQDPLGLSSWSTCWILPRHEYLQTGSVSV
jgi:hypothetical protein